MRNRSFRPHSPADDDATVHLTWPAMPVSAKRAVRTVRSL